MSNEADGIEAAIEEVDCAIFKLTGDRISTENIEHLRNTIRLLVRKVLEEAEAWCETHQYDPKGNKMLRKDEDAWNQAMRAAKIGMRALLPAEPEKEAP